VHFSGWAVSYDGKEWGGAKGGSRIPAYIRIDEVLKAL